MRAVHYFPNNESKRNNWLISYSEALPKYGVMLGLSGEEVAATGQDINAYIWYMQQWYPPTQQFAKDATAFKESMAFGGAAPSQLPVAALFPDAPAPCAPGLFDRIANQVKRLKLSSAYTEGIGQDMGIVSNTDNTEHTAPPVFTGVLETGGAGYHVRLDYKKMGHAGVAIEYRVNGGAWQLLGHFTQKSAFDDHPLAVAGSAESREYRMRWWDKDAAHGDWSTTQAVFVGQ